MFKNRDIVMLSKRGVRGFEEKTVHSCDGEVIIFENWQAGAPG